MRSASRLPPQAINVLTELALKMHRGCHAGPSVDRSTPGME